MNMKTVFIIKEALFLVLLIVLIIVAPNALLAADDLLLTVSDAGGDTGDHVTVNINIENATGTEGGQFVLNFDDDILKPIALETESFLEEAESSMEMVNLEYAPGQLMFIWITAAADTEDSGVLCTVTFELLKEGESLLEINEVIISPDGIDTSTEPGLVVAPADGVDVVADSDAVVEENRTSPIIIIIALLALAIAGYFAYRQIKKPDGGRH